jgi:hypothetical protein
VHASTAFGIDTHVCFARATTDEHQGCGHGMSVVDKDQDWLRMSAMTIFEVGSCVRFNLLVVYTITYTIWEGA